MARWLGPGYAPLACWLGPGYAPVRGCATA